ncbi:hypothetical protein JF66_09925 [Cryobacterium sp. MLB-32]|uniref:GyrI-like domain-containing protein n=1 Tax=Cryobacterium sp. MLB-32 TaxID=1529318 RepID=UPI0004E7AD67|nr:GyrI-like domain-containing protein [Cryobacterium sp. MLB-32]KFF59644.1 hypothetical protein JF66_09925 [Cryobacterium sp. MLB-32]
MDAQQIELEPRIMVGVHDIIPMDHMTEYFDRAFATAAAELSRQGVFPAGPPVAVYHGAPSEDRADITAGFPVAQPLVPTPAAVLEPIPGGPAIVAIHTGPYDTLAETYAELTDFLVEQSLQAAGDMWEEYLVGPDVEPDPGKWQTRIVFPLA